MDDFNKLLHDQQRALLWSQFSDCGQKRRILREAACVIGERIAAHPYGLIGTLRAGPVRLGSTVSGVSFA